MTAIAHASSATVRYTSVAIALHWAIAAAIVFQLVGGIWMVDFASDDSTLRFPVYQIHKTVGLFILALSLARLCWRLGHRAPAPLPNWTPLERAASHVVHIAFYVIMIAAPISGWLMASASPTNIPTFLFLQEWLPFAHLPGFQTLDLATREGIEDITQTAHMTLGYIAIALIVLHVGAALKHQFIDRDRILDRMRVTEASSPPNGRSTLSGIVAVVLAVGFIGGGLIAGSIQSQRSSGASTATLSASTGGNWAVLPEESVLGFEVTYNSAAVTGRFDNWISTIRFDPDDLANASAVVEIDMASYAMSDATLQTQAQGDDGFAVAAYPTARFESTEFRKADSGYVMDGILTLRGISAPVSIPFTFEAEDDTALVTGSAELNRIEFGIGAVGAPDESWIKHQVNVRFELRADREM